MVVQGSLEIVRLRSFPETNPQKRVPLMLARRVLDSQHEEPGLRRERECKVFTTGTRLWHYKSV